MNVEDLELVVDKVAEKIGVAASALQPVVEQLVTQIQIRYFMFAGGSFLFGLLFLGCIIYLYRWTPGDEPRSLFDSEGRIMGILLSFGCLLGSLLAFVINLSMALTPLPSLLKGL